MVSEFMLTLADRSVGPVLISGSAADAIIQAIKELNENVFIQDRGSYLRVIAQSRCVVTRQAIEENLGRPFSFPGDLEQVMSAFSGHFRVTENEASWVFEEGQSNDAET